MGRDESTNCMEAHAFLNGLCMECYVTLLTILDILCITTELVIRLGIIKDPHSDPTESPLASSLNVTNETYNPDPGGTCQQCSMETSLDVAHCVAHYSSVTIACVFMIEVVARVVAGCPGCWKDFLNVFDGFVVLSVCTMEVLFTVFWNDVICYHVAVEAATYVVALRFLRIPRACSVRKRIYAERLENEMHYLRKAKSKSEEHSRELATKLKRQQREILELQNRLSSASMGFSNENISSISTSDLSTPQISNGTLPNGFHTTTLDELDSVTSSITAAKQADLTDTKENGPKESASRESSVQYNSLLSEINSKRDEIHKKSLKLKPGHSRNTSPKKEANDHEVIYSNAHETTYMNTSGMYDGSGGTYHENNATDIVFHLDKIIRDNQSNGTASAIRDSAQSAQSVETDDDEALLIKRSYGAKSGSHVRASFAGRENKAFSHGEKTRASFTARESRANFHPGSEVNEMVKMRNLEVMAEYEGTRTYRSAEGIPLTDL
ncbi:uncharacterized protein LOC133172247 [Saccostrea echinata]|uniref:uncharacterized protein LOC133172247 n=1 Tax=Saccostrea echinata TaxID=191078 RepID=UPI002A835449|nr:uncharacterized protein LOC133172247 [Saccostrea echinata]